MALLYHLECQHLKDENEENMSEFEINLKKIFACRMGQSKAKKTHEPDIWYCPFPDCGYQHHKLPKMREHIEVKHYNNSYKCPVPGCNTLFSQKMSLQNHVKRVHRDERNYPCDICGKEFKNAGALRDHKMIHSGIRPYKCVKCGHGFIQITPWRKHMIQVCKVGEDQLPVKYPDPVTGILKYVKNGLL